MARKELFYKSSRYVASENRNGFYTLYDIKRFRDQGFKISPKRDNFYVITKPARIEAELTSDASDEEDYDTIEDIFNVSVPILRYYGRQKLSQKLHEEFAADAESGNLRFWLYDDGEVLIETD